MNPETLDRVDAEPDAFVASLHVDSRKLRSIEMEDPASAAAVQAHAATVGVPRRVLDPVHDPSFARLWLATLSDGQLQMLRRAIIDEAARRSCKPSGRGDAGVQDNVSGSKLQARV